MIDITQDSKGNPLYKIQFANGKVSEKYYRRDDIHPIDKVKKNGGG